MCIGGGGYRGPAVDPAAEAEAAEQKQKNLEERKERKQEALAEAVGNATRRRASFLDYRNQRWSRLLWVDIMIVNTDAGQATYSNDKLAGMYMKKYEKAKSLRRLCRSF